MIFLSLAPLCTQAQTFGIINDPDGYTNIRGGEGSNYEIVGKLEEGYKFKYLPNDKSSWWAVETIPYYGESIKGFVHKSRVQPYYVEVADGCGCSHSYTTGKEETILKANIGPASIEVCGYLLQRQSASSVKISEFTVYNCTSQEVLRFYGAVQTCQVTVEENKLQITELDRLPVGAGFAWVQVPYRQVELTDVDGKLTFSKERFVLDLSAINTQDIEAFEAVFPQFRGKGYFDELETFIGKLLVCSLKGSKKCRTAFEDIDNYLNVVLDGHFREFYNDCKEVLANSK